MSSWARDALVGKLLEPKKHFVFKVFFAPRIPTAS
jgi:hypothetical protein